LGLIDIEVKKLDLDNVVQTYIYTNIVHTILCPAREHAVDQPKSFFSVHPRTSLCHNEIGFDSMKVQGDAQNQHILSLDRP